MIFLFDPKPIISFNQDQTLEESYQMMAQDFDREAEALEWAEATIGDVIDETNYDR